MATSQNGWPALGSDSRFLHTWDIPTHRGVVRLRLRNGSAGFLLAHFALRFDEQDEPLKGGVLDDWGYNYRPIRGKSSGLSNHSSGTAMDLNATKHSLGRIGTFTNADARRIRADMSSRGLYRGSLRWGGQYRGRKDEMHVEVNVRMAQAEHMARLLMSSPRGQRIIAANPSQRAVILS